MAMHFDLEDNGLTEFLSYTQVSPEYKDLILRLIQNLNMKEISIVSERRFSGKNKIVFIHSFSYGQTYLPFVNGTSQRIYLSHRLFIASQTLKNCDTNQKGIMPIEFMDDNNNLIAGYDPFRNCIMLSYRALQSSSVAGLTEICNKIISNDISCTSTLGTRVSDRYLKQTNIEIVVANEKQIKETTVQFRKSINDNFNSMISTYKETMAMELLKFKQAHRSLHDLTETDPRTFVTHLYRGTNAWLFVGKPVDFYIEAMEDYSISFNVKELNLHVVGAIGGIYSFSQGQPTFTKTGFFKFLENGKMLMADYPHQMSSDNLGEGLCTGNKDSPLKEKSVYESINSSIMTDIIAQSKIVNLASLGLNEDTVSYCRIIKAIYSIRTNLSTISKVRFNESLDTFIKDAVKQMNNTRKLLCSSNEKFNSILSKIPSTYKSGTLLNLSEIELDWARTNKIKTIFKISMTEKNNLLLFFHYRLIIWLCEHVIFAPSRTWGQLTNSETPMGWTSASTQS